MIRVTIVDDENIVRIGLKTMIEWEELGFTVVGLFGSGKEALEYLTREPVDVILTDIKMSDIDGVDLIRLAKAYDPRIEVIALSNYDDFPYVSESFKHGAFDYLLKGRLEEQTLRNTLLKARDSVLEKQTGTLERGRGRDREAQRKLAFLDALLFGDASLSMLDRDREALEFLVRPPWAFCMVIMPFKESDGKIRLYDGGVPTTQTLRDTLTETTGKYGSQEPLLFKDDRFVLVFSMHGPERRSRRNARIRDLMEEIASALWHLFDLGAYLSCSDGVEELLSLRGAYREAETGLEAIFFQPEERFFFPSEPSHGQQIRNTLAPVLADVDRAIRLRDFEQVRTLLSEAFEQCGSRSVASASERELKRFLGAVFEQIDRYLESEFAIGIGAFFTDPDLLPVQRAAGLSSHSEARRMTELILDGVEACRAQRSSSGDVISRAKRFVEQHYAEKVSLKRIGHELNINSNYFCHVFYEKTGERFSHYLRRVRIEHAVRQIEEGDFSTEWIAENVGYPNPNYFVKVFKKVTGKTITDYRNSLRPAPGGEIER